MKKITVITLILFLLCAALASAKISERKLQQYRIAFLKKSIKDNPAYKRYIRVCLSGIIPQGNAGIRLIDKLALFMYDMRKNNISIHKIRFLYNKRLFFMLIMLQDKDGQLYNLFLEYKYTWRKRCILRNASFSLVFSKKQKQIIKFFENR